MPLVYSTVYSVQVVVRWLMVYLFNRSDGDRMIFESLLQFHMMLCYIISYLGYAQRTSSISIKITSSVNGSSRITLAGLQKDIPFIKLKLNLRPSSNWPMVPPH